MSSQWLKVEWIEQQKKGMLDFNGKYEINIHRSRLKSGKKEWKKEPRKEGREQEKKVGRKMERKEGKEEREGGKHKNTPPPPPHRTISLS